MPLGTEHSDTGVAMGDTAELTAFIFGQDDETVSPADLVGATFTIKRPDDPDNPIVLAGTIQADGSAFLRYADTDVEGLFIWTCQFQFTSGEKRTYRDEFSVYDPLAIAPVTWNDKISEQVWLKLEDCFDSEQGGPWLRDMTLSYFGPEKVSKFIAQGLLLINVIPPLTNLTLDWFLTEIPATDPAVLGQDPTAKQPDPDEYIIVQATLIAVIKHLMRSYVEQPDLRAQNVNWQDRRDYLQRWQIMLQIEQEAFDRVVALWKRQFYHFGQGALLIHSKAGRLYPTGWRARNAARGFW